jgi:hypothetical protein
MMSTSSNCTNLPSSLLVTGLVRNCAHSIRADIQRVQSAVQGLGRLRWLLIESDSDDGSVDELNKLAEEQSDFKFISLGELRSSKPFRTDRLAFCRNVYLAELHENPAYLDVDFLLVADFDGINTLLTPAAMRSCWHRNGWDVCAANLTTTFGHCDTQSGPRMIAGQTSDSSGDMGLVPRTRAERASTAE